VKLIEEDMKLTFDETKINELVFESSKGGNCDSTQL
jgi:hypothetical protein